MQWMILAAIGLSAGLLSGFFGIGGGLLVVPALLLIMHFDAHTAAATSLVALSVPVGVLAAYAHYSAGKIDMQHVGYGLLIGVCLATGAFFGARTSISMDPVVIKKAFAVFLVFAAALVWFRA